MFATYMHVLLPGDVSVGQHDHLPGLYLRRLLAKHLVVVGVDALDVRLGVHVLQPLFADLVLDFRRLGLFPLLAHEPLLHTNIIYVSFYYFKNIQ